MASYMQSSFGDASDTNAFGNLGYQASDGQTLWPFTEPGGGVGAIPRSQNAFGMMGMQVSHVYFMSGDDNSV